MHVVYISFCVDVYSDAEWCCPPVAVWVIWMLSTFIVMRNVVWKTHGIRMSQDFLTFLKNLKLLLFSASKGAQEKQHKTAVSQQLVGVRILFWIFIIYDGRNVLKRHYGMWMGSKMYQHARTQAFWLVVQCPTSQSHDSAFTKFPPFFPDALMI